MTPKVFTCATPTQGGLWLPSLAGGEGEVGEGRSLRVHISLPLTKKQNERPKPPTAGVSQLKTAASLARSLNCF